MFVLCVNDMSLFCLNGFFVNLMYFVFCRLFIFVFLIVGVGKYVCSVWVNFMVWLFKFVVVKCSFKLEVKINLVNSLVL